MSHPFLSSAPLEALDMAVSLQWREQDVEEPQADKQHGRQDLRSPGPAQLTPDLRSPSVHQRADAYKGKDGKEGDRKGQSARIHFEFLSFAAVVDCSDGPCNL